MDLGTFLPAGLRDPFQSILWQVCYSLWFLTPSPVLFVKLTGFPHEIWV